MSKDLTFVDGFVDGIVYAAQELVLHFDQPSMAAEFVVAGATLEECLKAQKRSGYETRKMNKFFREAFKERYPKPTAYYLVERDGNLYRANE